MVTQTPTNNTQGIKNAGTQKSPVTPSNPNIAGKNKKTSFSDADLDDDVDLNGDLELDAADLEDDDADLEASDIDDEDDVKAGFNSDIAARTAKPASTKTGVESKKGKKDGGCGC